MKRVLSVIFIIILLFPGKVKGASAGNGSGFCEPATPLPEFGLYETGVKAAVIDLDSSAIRAETAGAERARPGSLTVIMTALLLIENTEEGLWDEPTEPLSEVNSRWTQRASQMGLAEGMTPTRRDLLYGLMLRGAADAAFVTADIVSGSETAFVAAMNEKAAELGLGNTRFGNGYGLGAQDHYTCANDMAHLAAYAMRSEIFREAAAAPYYTCSEGCGFIELTSTNTALSDPACIGIKSGSDSEKEHCVITAVQSGELRLAAVVMDASSDADAFAAAERLFSSALSAYGREIGARPFLPTNALYTANKGAVLVPVWGGDGIKLEAGEVLRVCGSHEGVLYVERSGEYYSINRSDAEFLAFIDDVFIDNGAELSKELVRGERLSPAPVIRTRHRVDGVSVSIYLPGGDRVFTGNAEIGAHGTVTIEGTSLENKLRSFAVSDGIFLCELTVTVTCAALSESETVQKVSRSVFSMGTGGHCVTYNANMGDGAPNGECFTSDFTVPDSIPRRTGCSFTGWCDSADGSGQVYSPGERIDSDSSLTLYAMWSPASPEWSADIRALYDDGLILEGSIKNPAGIADLELLITNSRGQTAELRAAVGGNETAPSCLMEAPYRLSAGEYRLRLYGTDGTGARTLIYEGSVTAEASATEVPFESEAPAPTDNGEHKGFDISSVPIGVWFILGTALVVVLITAIVLIIKRGLE